MASAADIPNKFDCVIDDEGYCFYRPFTGGDTANVPELGIHSFSPAFVPRVNNDRYGDDSTDFYLTHSQKDWSLGQGRKYQGEERRRYWEGASVDVLTPGQVSIRPSVETVDTSFSTASVCYVASANEIALLGSTTLFTVDSAGTLTDAGAHGLGATPARWGRASDGTNLYFTTEDSGTNGVRQWDGTSFTSFSATASSTLAYTNNILFGLDKDGIFRKYDTSGTATTIHTFQDADGDAKSLGVDGRLCPFGSKLLILISSGMQTPELWISEGDVPSRLHRFSSNFHVHSIEELNGTAFISGWLQQSSGSYRATIYFYTNGQIGKLWEAESFSEFGQGGPDLAIFDEKLVFNDAQAGQIMAYNPTTGGVSSLGSYSPSESSDAILAAADTFLFLIHAGDPDGAQLVQAAKTHFGGGGAGVATPKAASWEQPTTEGNTLFFAIYVSDVDGSTVPTISTPSGWTLVATEDDALSSRLSLFKIENASSRSGTETIAWTGGIIAYVSGTLIEYSGITEEDVVATNNGTGTSADTGTTSTTTQNNELWLASFAWSDDLEGPTIEADTAGFELVTRYDMNVPGDFAAEQGHFASAVSSTGAATCEATLDNAQGPGNFWIGIISTWKVVTSGGTGFLYPGSSLSTGAYVESSLIDFDTSLRKVFSGIKVDYDEADDGDGGDVDISYALDSHEGDFTLLKEGAESGVEYDLSGEDNFAGQSITVRIALNKGTSTKGPVLKRLYIRAAPFGLSRHRAIMHLDCTDDALDNTGSPFPTTGHERAVALRTAAKSETVVSFADAFENHNVVVETCDLTQIRSGRKDYVATVLVREA